jgi:hypothetical protein
VKRVEAPCPSCGAPVEFKTSSALVTICTFCHSAVARGDQRLEDWGKVAALAATGSPLHLGMTGRYGDAAFEIVGHVQYQHSAGGMWDEWYAAFSNDRWGWLAEAQGRIYLTFEKPSAELPPFGSLTAGETVSLGDAGDWTIAEVGRATGRGAEGEMPYAFTPGGAHDFADIAGPQGRFGTLDYSGEAPRLFVGQQITLADLGLTAAAVAKAIEEAGPVEIGAKQVACPNCGGSLDLKAPDQTQRVACPYCSALLDCDQGNLKYLLTLDAARLDLKVPLGKSGELLGTKYTAIGYLQRSVTFDREYTWDEYLLYEPVAGFRWLVNSDGHWNFVEPVSPGDIQPTSGGVRFKDRTFKIFQRADATVKHVLGEFYWKVAVGETVLAEDYIAPPAMISIEHSFQTQRRKKRPKDEAASQELEATGEVNVSLGTYLPHETLEKAFGIGPLPRGWGVAPNQPPPANKAIYKYWLLFAASLLVIDLVMSAVRRQPIDHWISFWAFVLVSLMPAGTMLYNHSFERSRWADSEFNPYASSGDDDDDDDDD